MTGGVRVLHVPHMSVRSSHIGRRTSYMSVRASHDGLCFAENGVVVGGEECGRGQVRGIRTCLYLLGDTTM